MVQSIVAVVEDNMSFLSVRSTMNIKTFLSVVSDVSVGTSVPSDLLGVLTSVWLNVGSNVDSEAVSSLVGDSIVSFSKSSDSLSS